MFRPHPGSPLFLILDWPMHLVPVPIETTSFVTEGGKKANHKMNSQNLNGWQV